MQQGQHACRRHGLAMCRAYCVHNTSADAIMLLEVPSRAAAAAAVRPLKANLLRICMQF